MLKYCIINTNEESYMKKKMLFSALTAAAALAAYIFTSLNGTADYNTGEIKKLDKIPVQIQQVQKEGLAPNKYVNAFVTKVVDGDTIAVTYKGDSYKVRLLYIDTPESVYPGVPAQPYSKEASSFCSKSVLTSL
jgi:endonuclease YncB( thermonuclease family)